ncbi:MAG TPA: hypothetical protein VGR81_06345 [Candidatus Acidoferrales bacterium]|nr:hypothetical protein [Candidatus Acidoferrales bacterium]
MTKKLSTQDAKNRIAEALSDATAGLFGISDKKAERDFRAALQGEPQNETSILQAALIYTLNKRLKRNLQRSKGQRMYSEEEIETVCRKLKSTVPEMATAIRKGFKDMLKGLPRRGGPGRGEILSAAEKMEACDQITFLLKRNEVKRWRDIFESVAEQFRTRGKNVSARTIKRAWESRENLFTD